MNGKSKIAAALLAFFLGGMGIHRYYLGYVKKGIVQTLGFIASLVGYVLMIVAIEADLQSIFFISIALLIFGCVTSIWAFVDFIRILLGRLKAADGSEYAG